jgi:hypothetical protein
MPLDFARTHVAPGEPVTADAWNALVDGLFEAQSVLKAAGATARVRITAQGLDPARVRVTATREGAPPAEAIRPIAPDTSFVFPRLPEGAYVVRAEAPGFNPAQGALTVTADGKAAPDPLELALTASREVMPRLLGEKLPAALALIPKVPARIVDVSGRDLPRTGFDPSYADKPVLMQWPLPGELAPPAGADAHLVVAAAVSAQTAQVPNLSNMTLSQATAALQQAGLEIRVVDANTF